MLKIKLSLIVIGLLLPCVWLISCASAPIQLSDEEFDRGSVIHQAPQLYCAAPGTPCWWAAKVTDKHSVTGVTNWGANWQDGVRRCTISAVRVISEEDTTVTGRPQRYSVTCKDADSAVVGQLVFVPKCGIGCVVLGQRVADVLFMDRWEED